MKSRDLVNAYALNLERQIAERHSSLVCRDEEMWKKMEEQLTEGDPQEVHCLGLDPLRVMEESLKAAETSACSRRPMTAGVLQRLAQAFEVLEQAAVNLYLGPWRTEYKVIKMYSGVFTHHIIPALSLPQIENLFGLLGYEVSPSRPEHLCLQTARVGASSLDDLLRLACAFYAARCECRVVLEALGKRRGDVEWELSVVKERQRGNGLQVALDNTKKTLEVCQPVMEPPGGGEEDLYGEELVNGGQRKVVVKNDESTPSSMSGPQSIVSVPAVKTHSNGVSTPLELDTSSKKQDRSEKTESQSVSGLNKREPEVNHYCSCLQSPGAAVRHCLECDILHDIGCDSFDVCWSNNHRVEIPDAVTKAMKASAALSTQRGSLRGKKQDRRPGGESRSEKIESQSVSGLNKREPEVNHYCSCLQSPATVFEQCIDCDTLHDITCASLEVCRSNGHKVVNPDRQTEDIQESAVVSPQRESLRGKKQDRRPGGESRSVKRDSQTNIVRVEVNNREPEVNHHCSCLQSPGAAVRHCLECDILHNIGCDSFDVCWSNNHRVEIPDAVTKAMKASAAVTPNKTHISNTVGMSTLALHDDPMSITASLPPITYHGCCDLKQLDPQILCHTCKVFHNRSCPDKDLCLSDHQVSQLGQCLCGRYCARKPLVLCRYCGREYCSHCWYKSPVSCSCGQTFDQGSPV